MKKILLILLIIIMLPITIKAESKYLYDVLKNEAENNGLAKEYTGEHHDSFTEEPSKKIYYWNAKNDDEGNQVLEKNNLIFANHCWQMIRTTDTGGVKLLYNGEVEDNKCLDTRNNHVGYGPETTQTLNSTYYYGTSYTYDKTNNVFSLAGNITTGEIKLGEYTCKKNTSDGTCTTLYLVDNQKGGSSYNVIPLNANSIYSQFGKLQYNIDSRQISAVGYMYNEVAKIDYKCGFIKQVIYDHTTDDSYWYADDIIYENGKYQLVNPYHITSENIDDTVNKYTYFSSEENKSESHVSYVVKVIDNHLKTLALNDGKRENDYMFTYGENYVKNDDGTYTIENPTTVYAKDWYDINTALYDNYACIDTSSNTCNTLNYVVKYSSNYYYGFTTSNGLTKFGESYEYNNGTYTLKGDKFSFFEFDNDNLRNQLENHRYTCLNTEDECEQLAYVYKTGGSYIYYVLLKDGKNQDDILNESFYIQNINQQESTIKKGIDNWYKKELVEFNDYIEDTIYCNNREITRIYGLNLDTPLQGNYNITFKDHLDNNINVLKCNRETDSFSVSNLKANLTYPIGLLSSGETRLSHTKSFLKTNDDYWLMTPRNFSGHSTSMTYLDKDDGFVSQKFVSNESGLRPVISLKPGIKHISGNGSKDEPYTIDYTKYYGIDVEINNETEDLTVEIDDLSQVPEGETVNFKVTPIKGHKVTSIRILDDDNNEINYTTTDNKHYTFTMPATDVTIKPSYERVKNAVNVEDNKNTKEFVIEVNDSQAVVYEDTVRFRVDPEEGYEVEKIEITDEEQNNINYRKTNNINEYEFIMPDTNVLIKPFYRLIPTNGNISNPNTKRQILLIIISIIILSIMTFIYIKKKKHKN